MNGEASLVRIENIMLARDAPISQAGVYLPLLADGSGNLRVAISSGSTGTTVITPSDGLSNNTNSLATVGLGELFNDTTWDRQRNNTEGVLLASAARVASVDSADQVNYNARGVHVIINVSALAATPSIIPTIQGKDPISGTYYTILTGLPITTTGINIIKVYPGISAVVNASASDLLPRTWRLSMAHADADSITYSAAFALVL